MRHEEFITLMNTLKKVLKGKKIRYQQVAAHLGTSEVTVKRMFSGHPCNIGKIMDVCELAEISFFELTELAAKPTEETYFLSADQEQHFADYPGQYAIFKDLVRGKTPAAIQADWQLGDRKFYRVLRQLEELGLLEVLSEGKVRLVVKGMVRIDENGPIARSLVFQQNLDFLGHVQEHVREPEVCYHSVESPLTANQIKEMVAEIHALGRKYRIQSQQVLKLNHPDKVKTVRWLFAFSQYRTDWKGYKI